MFDVFLYASIFRRRATLVLVFFLQCSVSPSCFALAQINCKYSTQEKKTIDVVAVGLVADSQTMNYSWDKERYGDNTVRACG